MAAPAVDNIVNIKLVGSFLITPYDRLVTSLNYRCANAGSEDPEEPELAAIAEAFIDSKLERLLDNLPVTYAMNEIRVEIIYPDEASYMEIRPLSLAEGSGNLAQTGASSQTAAACLTRRSFKPGRRGIGRVFFGPLVPQFMSGDNLVVDPVGDGDLRDVVSALGETLTTPAGFEYKPCIFGSVNEGPVDTDAEMDIRNQAFAPLISHLRSRRLNSL